MGHDNSQNWVDPYDSGRRLVQKSLEDRRRYPRSEANYRLHIATHRGAGEKPLVAQGEVINVSVNGVFLKTRQSLEVGQIVDLAIPTKGCPEDFALPKAFLGKARVARVESLDKDIRAAALAVDQDLLDDMSYAVFVEYQRRKTTPKR